MVVWISWGSEFGVLVNVADDFDVPCEVHSSYGLVRRRIYAIPPRFFVVPLNLPEGLSDFQDVPLVNLLAVLVEEAGELFEGCLCRSKFAAEYVIAIEETNHLLLVLIPGAELYDSAHAAFFRVASFGEGLEGSEDSSGRVV